MAVTSKLKNKVDLPVWEWLRPAINSVTTGNSTITEPSSAARFIYYMNSNNGAITNFNRYDQYSDSYQSLAPLLNTFNATAGTMTYSKWHGHYGRVISAGTGSNTLELAGLQGNALVGYKIRIISGKGAGQERTITAVSDPIIKERGTISNNSTTQVIDATGGAYPKQWPINKWRDYQVRVIYGSTAGSFVRPILYNNYTTLTFSDAAWASVTPWWGPTSPTTTTANSTLYQIESNIITVDSNWTTVPDSTSNFEVLSDSIWFINAGANGPYYHTITYYDIIGDLWYNKTYCGNILTAQLATDVTSEKYLEYPVYALSGVNNISATTRSLLDPNLATGALSAMQYTNYGINILSGTGAGQYRSIVANTSAGNFIIGKNWDITPDSTSAYGIYRDVNKLYWTGNGGSTIFQYDVNSDQMIMGKIYDYGVCRVGSVSAPNGMEPLAISSITRSTGGATAIAIATAGSGYTVDTIITFTGGAVARVTAVNSTGGITAISIENVGSAYAGGGAAMTITGATPALPSGGVAATFTNTTASIIGTLVTVASHHFKQGDVITIVGDTNSAPNFNNSYTVIATNSVTSLQFITAATATAVLTTITTTSLVDYSKNWTVNEHVGKIVQMTLTASTNATMQARKIVSNTANTLTWTLVGTAPINSTTRYAIVDEKPFAVEQSIGSVLGNGRSGIATYGTTSSLTDVTKNWPVNYWTYTSPTGASNTARKVKIIAGTGNGNELVITSNTANTLNFATQTFTVDNTTVYEIMDNFGQASVVGSTSSLTDTTQNWGNNMMIGKRIRITSGSGLQSETAISANTQTTLTFGLLNAAVDTSTSYAILEPTPKGAGIGMFNIRNSSNSSLNTKYFYMFRGNATAELNRYNIATEQQDAITFFPQTETLTTGTMYAYDGADRIYFTKDQTGRVMYYDITKNLVFTSSTIPYGMGTTSVGNRMEIVTTADGLQYLYVFRHSGQEVWRTLIFW